MPTVSTSPARMKCPTLVIALFLPWLFADCTCGVERLSKVDPCATHPASCVQTTQQPPPSIQPPPPLAQPPAVCTFGNIAGRVCAPDSMTWLNGARVSVDAVDCSGAAVHIETISGQGGTFTLGGVPSGTVTVHASEGSFSQDTGAVVTANQTTTLADNQLCVAQKATRIAVVTGPGDRIESLLDDLGLTYDLYDGTTDFAAHAAPFLRDAAKLAAYQIVFVDCAAAHTASTIDLGSDAASIAAALSAYVSAGGALYASDWAALFATVAAPQAFDFLTSTGAPVKNPLVTKILMGFAPQQLTATVSDPGLAAFLGVSTVAIKFPKQSGANSLHWGLLQDAQGTVLVEAAKALPCATEQCQAAGSAIVRVPLAVSAQVGHGKVIYTSFHNVGQDGTAVAQLLKYLILQL